MNLFIEAWKDAVLKNYANFAGRLGVAGFWRFYAVQIAAAVVLVILMQIASIFWILYLIWGLGTIVPGLAAFARRLHDTGKSGWLILVTLIPCVGLILLIVWGVQPGNPETNTYGPPAGPTPAPAA